jgi:subtilisin family serine protease
MARRRTATVVTAALALGLVLSALTLGAATGRAGREDGRADRGPEAASLEDAGREDDDDDGQGDADDDDDGQGDADDDDDAGGGTSLEPQPIAGRGPPRIRYVPGELVVRFRPGTSNSEMEAAAARAGGTVADHIAELGLHVVRVPPSQTEEAVASLRSEASVESVEREVLLEGLDTIPNDALWPAQWGLRLIGAPRAWDVTTGAGAVVIAVLDTGVSARHEDLAGASVAGRDLVNDDSDPADDEGHGTSVAGVIAARTNNGEGQAGVCWGCSLMPVKVMDSTGTGKTSTVAAGIVWAVDHGARVVNLSLGSPGTTSALASAVAYAASKNAVLVAAAGNSGADTHFYPAAYGEVISVGATNEADVRYEWSNHGDWVRVSAPGCNAAPRLGGGYIEFCGTSSSAPIVAGVAGLALSLNPSASKSEVERAIGTNATPVDGARFGRVEALEVMRAVSPTGSLNPLPSPPPPPPPSAVPPPPAPAPVARRAPANLKRPRLVGRARVGRVMRVAPGIWSPAPNRLAFQWRRCRRTGAGCRAIRGARGRTYRIKPRDEGRRLRVVVVAVNANGAARALTRASAVVRRPRRR